MKLYFENSYCNTERLIAEVKDEDEAFKEIHKFLDDYNYKSYYTRTWMRNKNEKVYDVGSHSQFFILKINE